MGGDSGCHGACSAPGVPHQEEYNVDFDGFFFLTLGSYEGLFHMSAFTPCSFFISLQLHVTYEFIMYDTFDICEILVLFLFVAQNNCFCPAPGHLSSCIF